MKYLLKSNHPLFLINMVERIKKIYKGVEDIII